MSLPNPFPRGEDKSRVRYWRIMAAKDNAVDAYPDIHSKECDFETGDPVNALTVVPVYYNPSTLKFEWGQRPQIDIDNLDVSMGDVEALLAASYFKQDRIEYDVDGNPVYLGKNTDMDSTEGTATWMVWKLHFTDGNMDKKEGPRIGSWTGRAALDWGF